MKDKHFEISIHLSHHSFSFCCTTVHEAYDAVADIVTSMQLGAFLGDLDRIIETLVAMKNGQQLSTSNHYFSIFVRDGEV